MVEKNYKHKINNNWKMWLNYGEKRRCITLTTFIFVFFVLILYIKLLLNVNKCDSSLQYNFLSRSKLKKPRIMLFVGIYSWHSFIDRRNAIRNTWMPYCKSDSRSVCFFMMDGLDYKGNPISEGKKTRFKMENNTYQDIMIQDSFEGINFAYRYFITLIWANRRYDFQFLLRADDDSYFCYHRLMYELPFRRKEKNLMWGYERCRFEQTEIDEGWMIVSKDLALQFVNRFNTTLICHKYTSAAIALFIIAMEKEFNVTWFADVRVHFHQPSKEPIHYKNLCNNYIGVHRVYAKQILDLHQHFLNTNTTDYKIPPVKDFCPDSHKVINVHRWPGRYFGLPALCKEKPIWSEAKMYVGRERRKE